MKNRHFLYAPRSGAKWITKTPGMSVPVVQYANESAHVVGSKITAYTASPGSWWRDDAVELFQYLAECFGGVAWDNCGWLSLVVHPTSALLAFAVVQVANPLVNIGQLGGFGDNIHLPSAQIAKQMCSAVSPRAAAEYYIRSTFSPGVTPIDFKVRVSHFTIDDNDKEVKKQRIVLLNGTETIAEFTTPHSWSWGIVSKHEEVEPEEEDI